jgi:hypothetical protein
MQSSSIREILKHVGAGRASHAGNFSLSNTPL